MGYLTHNRRRALILSGIILYMGGYIERGLGLICKMINAEIRSILNAK